MALTSTSMSLRLLIVGVVASLVAATIPTHVMLRGISYGPVPLKSIDRVGSLPQDDWMADPAVSMWGRSGRGDLRVIREMGANLIRLYGNNPNNDHTNFLDAAHAENLYVFPGMSDYPYTQMPGRCIDTGFDCFEQIKAQYTMNLEKGFMTPDNKYHPSLKVMNIINEPDLKLPHDTTIGGAEGPVKMARGIVSALDAMLDAERELQVTGPLVNFTATFSYAICSPCARLGNVPALAQMASLHDAFMNPQAFGYSPRNNVTEAYRTRWTNSFNTQNPATEFENMFLKHYTAEFPDTPFYIGEYHRVGANQTEDLSLMMQHMENSNVFLGISFFQYQVAYWKTGSEMDFGMFGLGDYVHNTMQYFGQEYEIHCLVPEESAATGTSIANAVTTVYAGSGIVTSELCLPNPYSVPLSNVGYDEIVSQQSPPRMEQFVRRVVEHLGATVSNWAGLSDFSSALVRDSTSFADAVSQVAYGPDWVNIDPNARCVANRDATPHAIGEAIGWVCSRATGFSCSDVTTECDNTYRTADYVFSRYYQSLGNSASPLQDCDFGGAGQFAAPAVFLQWTGSDLCVEGASPMTTTQPGQQTTTTQTEEGSVTTTSAGVDDDNATTTEEVRYAESAALSPRADSWPLLALAAVALWMA